MSLRAYLQLVSYRWATMALVVMAGLPACDAFRTHPYAVPQDEELRDLTRKNLSRLAALPQQESFVFAALSDSQRWEDETRDAVPSINADPDVAFAVHVGDITEFGLAREYIWMEEFFRELRVPLLTVVGNHDLLGNGGNIYDSVYGPRNYTFQFGTTKFVMVDSNSREYGLQFDIPDLSWVERELLPDAGWDQAVVVAHVPFDNDDFRPDYTAPWLEILQRHDNVVLSLYGHTHAFRDELVERLRVVVADKMEGRNWVKIKVTPGEVEIEQVFY